LQRESLCHLNKPRAKAYDGIVLMSYRRRSCMDHDVHLPEDVDRAGVFSKVIAALVIAAAIAAICGYVVCGSGMWA